MDITVEDGSQISDEAVQELKKHADMIECECPARLMEILEQVRSFTEYIDQLLSTTLIQLARYEGFINEDNEIVERQETH